MVGNANLTILRQENQIVKMLKMSAGKDTKSRFLLGRN